MCVTAILLLPVLVDATPTSTSGRHGTRSSLPPTQLLSPANDSWVIEMPLVLCWTYTYGSIPQDDVSFFIQIDNAQDFQYPEVDTGLGSAEYSFSPTSILSMAGSYFWHVMAKNASSNETAWSEIWHFNLDYSGPYVIRAGIVGNHGYTANRNVTISLVARDNSGVDSMRHSFDKSNWSDWVQYVDEFNVKLGPVDGKWTVYVQVRDRFDHRSEASPLRIVLDTVIPSGSIIINNDSMYATSARVLLGLAANDTNGIRNMTVSNFADFHDAIWMPYNTTLGWDLPPD
jgi:hypothetical protein